MDRITIGKISKKRFFRVLGKTIDLPDSDTSSESRMSRAIVARVISTGFVSRPMERKTNRIASQRELEPNETMEGLFVRERKTCYDFEGSKDGPSALKGRRRWSLTETEEGGNGRRSASTRGNTGSCKAMKCNAKLQGTARNLTKSTVK